MTIIQAPTVDFVQVFADANPHGRVARCIACDPDGRLQQLTVSPLYSPGIVRDEEVIARFVESPIHNDRGISLPGELNDAFFSDLWTIGFSTRRTLPSWEATAEPSHEIGDHHAAEKRLAEQAAGKTPRRRYLGCIHFQVSVLRTNSLRVYDTANPNDRLHAEAMGDAVGDSKTAKKARSIIRSELALLATAAGIHKAPGVMPDDPELIALNIDIH